MSFHYQPYHSVAGRGREECGLRTSTSHHRHALAISLSASILSTASNMAVHITTPKDVEGKQAQKQTINRATLIKTKIPSCSNEPTPSCSASTPCSPPLQLPDMPTEECFTNTLHDQKQPHLQLP
jgi:hypothetical protein